MEHKGTVEIKTKRLLLRKYKLEDAQQVFENWARDERVTKFLTWKAYENVDGVREFISTVIEQYDNKNYYDWIITLDETPIGSISAVHVNDRNEFCEIGYCIGFEYWSKGFTAESMDGVIKFLFEEVKVHRIMAKHDIDNVGSGKVMRKCNMIYEGTLHGHYKLHDGSFSDSDIYGIVIDEYFDNIEQSK